MSRPCRIVILNTRKYHSWQLYQSLCESGHDARHIWFTGLNADQIFKTLGAVEQFKPDFCFQMLYELFDPKVPIAPFVEEFFRARNIPVISWFSDGPLECLSSVMLEKWDRGFSPSNGYFLCMNSDHAEFFREKGLSTETLFFPVNERLADFVPTQEQARDFSVDFSFSGSAVPIPEAFDLSPPVDLKRLHLSYYFSDLQKSLMAQAPESGENISKAIKMVTPAVETFFSNHFATSADYKKARNIFLKEVQSFQPPFDKLLRYNFSILSHAYSYFQMSTYLQRLLPEGLQLFGAPWDKILGFPKPGNWLGMEDFHSLCKLSKISFSYSKWQLMETFNERPLVTLALGGFPLADHRASIDEMFEPDEIATYRSIDEAIDKTRYYLKHESERLKIAEKGRRRVLNNYTLRHFGEKLVEIARDRWKLVQ